MALRNHHTILKHYLDLNLKVEKEEYVMAEVETMVKEKIELPMEAIFNEFCSEDVVMQFDKIYLDLGVINPAHLKEELVSAYCRALRHFFEQKLAFSKNFSIAGGPVYGDILSESRQMTVTEKIQEDIFHFLKYGYWPVLSSAAKENYDQLFPEQLEQSESFADRVLEMISQNAVAATRFELQTQPAAVNILLKRWKGQMAIFERVNFHLVIFIALRCSADSDLTGRTIPLQLTTKPAILKQFSEMAKWIQGKGFSFHQQFRQELETLFSSGYFIDNSISEDLRSFWKEILKLISSNQSPRTATEESPLIKTGNDTSNSDDRESKENKQNGNADSPTSSQDVNESGEQQFSNDQADNNKNQTSSSQKEIFTNKPLAALETWREKHDSFTRNELPDKAVFISNAGLVLLHPFLPAFFKALGLVEDNAFRDTESAQKAIHLLEYLATGTEQPLEAGLIFNKILCGWPVEMPLSRFIGLSSIEKNEARSLLQAVVTHWSALKNSSPEALQQAFLTRPGKLTDDAGIWQLKVESSGLDILLGQLPWSISVIKLPWMIGHIIVDWN
jgi:hypothetical protein